MAQTAQAQVDDMIRRASALGDDVLAAEIRSFADARQYGLVFEHNRPERMRLYGKDVVEGDVVQILPERGKPEDDASKLLWRVVSVEDGCANLTAYRTASYADNIKDDRKAPLGGIVAISEYDQPIYAGLRETGRVERGGDKPYQVVINGENYHALEALTFAYAGKVDCIYIDPPYNTGARDWKYNNDYVDTSDAYRHSKWLAFMERRLKLAKQLLNPKDSVLIVTIDEKEYLRLGVLLEELFPSCPIQMISAVINPSGSSRGNMFSRSDEYIYFVFLGNSSVAPSNEDMLHAPKKKREVRWDGLARRGEAGKRSARPKLFYPVFFSLEDGSYKGIGDAPALDVDRNDVPIPDGCFAVFPLSANGEESRWGIQPSTFVSKQSKGYIKFGPWKKGSKKRAIYHLQDGTIEQIEKGEITVYGKDEDGTLILGELNKPVRPMTTWTKQSLSAGDYGSTLLRSFIPGRSFPFPKSLYAVEDTIGFFVRNKKDALVVDYFSGSGTTAHAVMRLNHQDGGKRRCICITNNEVSEQEAKKLTKQGLCQGDSEWEAFGICEYITKPRVTAAITGKTPDGDPIKGDYKFADEFPMADGFEENAIFFDLTYQEPDAVELGAAFAEVAPLLWLQAGARGSIIEQEQRGYAIADSYAILFNYPAVGDFLEAVRASRGVKYVYIVTDDQARHAALRRELGAGYDVVQLYESYLQSFKIAAEGAVM